MCYSIGRGANIENTAAIVRSILRYQNSDTIALRRWAKDWLTRNHQWVKTICSKPLEAKCRASHIEEDMEGHFKEYKRCKKY